MARSSRSPGITLVRASTCSSVSMVVAVVVPEGLFIGLFVAVVCVGVKAMVESVRSKRQQVLKADPGQRWTTRNNMRRSLEYQDVDDGNMREDDWKWLVDRLVGQ